MIALSWLLAVGAVVLGALGIVKLVDPNPTSTMLDAVGMPGHNLTARLLGVVEVMVAVAVLADGPQFAAVILAGMYSAFAIGLLVLRHRSPSTPCGCVGRWSGPPSYRHVAIDAVLAMAAATCVATATTSWPALSGAIPTTTYWLVVIVGSIAVIAAMSGPARRPAGGRRAPTNNALTGNARTGKGPVT